MSGIDIAIVKGASADTVEIRRPGAWSKSFRFPKKGPVPHDAVHIYVESELQLKRGFWGMVAEGIDPAAIQEIAKNAGHASAKRASPPAAEIVELIQAERLVECFEAELWSPGAAPDTFREIAEAACAASYVSCPDLPDRKIEAIRAHIADFAEDWKALSEGQRVTFTWPA